jgi:hypothetical protein
MPNNTPWRAATEQQTGADRICLGGNPVNESARDQERTFRKPLRSCLMKGVMVMILAMLVAAEVFGAAPPGVFVRVALLSPREAPWRMHIVAHHPGGKQTELFAGKNSAAAVAQAGWISAPRSDWIELTFLLGQGVPSVRFLFETQPALGVGGVEARFEVATAAGEAAIVRTMTEHDPGNVIALRVASIWPRTARGC